MIGNDGIRSECRSALGIEGAEQRLQRASDNLYGDMQESVGAIDMAVRDKQRAPLSAALSVAEQELVALRQQGRACPPNCGHIAIEGALAAQ